VRSYCRTSVALQRFAMALVSSAVRRLVDFNTIISFDDADIKDLANNLNFDCWTSDVKNEKSAL
jgi:hypothetical protein